MKRQWCASSYVIDFANAKVLLMYNKKLHKWLQPGGHVKEDELPIDAAIREVKEETGIDIKIIGESFDGKNIQPIAVEHYLNSVGDMIDIQYLSIPLHLDVNSLENNEVIWQDIFTIDQNTKIDLEIKEKTKQLYRKYKF